MTPNQLLKLYIGMKYLQVPENRSRKNKHSINRNKSLEQKESSLSNFKETIVDTQQLNTIISNLTVIKGKPAYKNPRQVLPGALISFQHSKRRLTISLS